MKPSDFSLSSLSQAKSLQRRVRAALKAVALTPQEKALYTETEVLFRFNALEGILIMANNDISRMVWEWEDEP